ncbi:protein MODIFYING WALL LIGNIN-1 [Physcomitrium patens]|uniref:Uncharacterized protein n=1 Tax=Physcomitrium patens TaxID=3218 RepID=A9TF18_PHYPA|nr:uncharacterized protein LOC112277757 [Physcomitrium patens]XP_024366221.1 uncharacterized protein LOC112277757 [Physcomitrium patens]PNR26901.1 hypothetical protein PHYPA_030382 [Physcomitrium patens]|eukprot:XP_024366220.1 uncharacterized protein LOC112277757 [Physcomitrella patens]
MGSASFLVICISAVLYLVAFGLALGAMEKRSKGDLTVVNQEMGTLKCHYTSDIATGLAAGAFIFFLIAQIFVMIVTRCLCCGNGYKPGGSRTFAILVFIFSWLSFLVAIASLIAGASQNKIQTKGLFSTNGPNVTCRQVQKSLFAAASAFIFITMLLTEIYYVLISRAQSSPEAWQSYQGGPSVGMSAYT